MPSIPFPQRLAKAALERKYCKFVEILKKLEINIPFLDTISEMPSYAKFLKDLLSSKKKYTEHAIKVLTEECISILQNKTLPKLADPGSFSIPCSIGEVKINKALCDSGVSVSLMPLSICKRLMMGELKPTLMSLQLADRSIK